MQKTSFRNRIFIFYNKRRENICVSYKLYAKTLKIQMMQFSFIEY